MKTRLLNIHLWSLFIALFISSSLIAGEGDFSKSYKKEFKATSSTLLKINSEFTDIKAYNWDKELISIEVTVSVDARNQSKAADKLNKVIVEMEATPDLVSLTTGYKSNMSGNSNLEIEVLIYYPSHIQLDLENEFGSCLFENIDGSAKVQMEYGDFEAHNLNSGNLDLDVEFGKIRLQKFQAGKVEVDYGGFETQYAGMLKLDSEFSSVEIQEINQIELETAYDKIYIGHCDIAFIDSEFSSLRFDKINKSLELSVAYGSFNLKSIASDFEKIFISSEFTGVNLNFNEPLNFAFSVEAEMGDFKYPKDRAHITFIEKEMMELSLKGYFGTAKNKEAKLILSLENASATINVNE